ncbi:uncharacterized protein LOC143283048 [Babylonia areolata]|uniref:uncharacterized protein LOC143283048 n=1 Tax=Babylonia areolata TaxID=304850 RepID=UPI003FD1BE2C
MESSGGPGLDLSGKLIIKVQLGDDIRRIPIHNEDITYDELVLMMQRVYRGKLSTNDDIVIKYKDEDGDLITIFDSSDLTFAIQCSRILKITLFVNGKQTSGVENVQSLRKELQTIRDGVNALLDRIQAGPSASSSLESAVPAGTSEDGVAARPGEGKEFDPFSAQRSVAHDSSAQNKVTSSAASHREGSSTTSTTASAAAAAPTALTERTGAATPDSLSSIGSSASHQFRQQQQQQQQAGSVDGVGVAQSQHPPPVSYAAAVSQHGGYPGPYGAQSSAAAQPAPPTGQPPTQFPPSSTHATGQAPPPSSARYPPSSSTTAAATTLAVGGPGSQYGGQPQGSGGQGSQLGQPAGQQQPPLVSQPFPGGGGGYMQPGQAYGQYPQGQPQPQPQPHQHQHQQQQQQPQQQGQGMYPPGTAPPPSPGQPQQQPPPPPPPQQQMPQPGYPSGAWNMQGPGQQKVVGGFPSPPGPTQQPGGGPSPAGPNPYSRGPGYGAGYPRPAPSYQQGYQ